MNFKTLEKINQLEARYCKNCLIKKIKRDEESRTQAHKFCISECSVGLKIRSHGNQLQ
ncbi:zinc-finger domain-containing protein [Corticicoccus populi]|uniref:Zinc-finger domain-containing protein n=1 Tax=Corticicoccus populi TaxID=1812821 RepID=A0ABW5WVQ5_9STAP